MSSIKQRKSSITTGYLWSFFGAYLRPGNLGSASHMAHFWAETCGGTSPQTKLLECDVANDERPAQTLKNDDPSKDPAALNS